MSSYSEHWRAAFGEPDAVRTEADVAFLQEALPLPDFRRVLDVACGSGRHDRALSALGYEVVGVDNDPAVSPDVLADMRDLSKLPRDFDAVINFWASFGYFDEAENARVLASFGERLRLGGRIVLDLYNRAFFERRGDQERELAPGITERSTISGNRRRVELRYADGHIDVFDWQLFAPEEIGELGATLGLSLLTAVASPDVPAMQFVLERKVA